MPIRLLTRRVGPLGLALTAYDIWRRIPSAQRRQLLAATRKHGPRLAAQAVERGRKARAARRGKRL
jgi:hypothetical protein